MQLTQRTLKVPLAAALIVSAVASSPARGQLAPDDARLIAAGRQFIPEVLRVDGVRGIQVAIARHSAVIFTEGFGTASPDDTPMSANTVFAAGSMSKTYTATAIMQLVEQGKLALDTPINTYLRAAAGFEVVNPLGSREITIRDLMTHRSGLTSDAAGSELTPPAPLPVYLREQYSLPRTASYSGSAFPLWSAKVGEKFQYSNLGVATLGLLVQIANPEHVSYEEYVDRHIFQPLGMHSSQFPALQDSLHLRPDIARRFARGFTKLGSVDLPSPHIYLGDYPAGTLVTTAGDHVRLLLAYLNGGAYNGQRILRPESVKLLLTEGATPGMGLIWWLRDIGQPDFNFSHGGAYMFGWRNDFRAYPSLDLAVVAATNQWDMLSPSYGRAYAHVLDFFGSWVDNERRGLRHPQGDESWAWKVSYVRGLVWVDQLMGALGPRAPLTGDAVDLAAHGARPRDTGAPGDWDETGFRAGVKDMQQVPMQIDSIRAFLHSDRIRVWPEELSLIYAALGAQRDFIPDPEMDPQSNSSR